MKVQLKGNDAEFLADKRKLTNNLIEALEARFASEKDHVIIKATRLLSFDSWPEKEDMAGAVIHKTYFL